MSILRFWASFSSTGPDVELIAPGVSILSTIPGGGYGTKNGTSMASPHVAGIAALVWAANTGLSNYEVRTILQNNAEDLGLSSNHQGFGLARADLAVAAASGTTPEEPEPEPDPNPEPDPEESNLEIVNFELSDAGNPSWFRVNVQWTVSGASLQSVKSELILGGTLVDSATSSISGDSASGEHLLRNRDGHDETYEVTLTVIDSAGVSYSQTKSFPSD